MTEGLLLYVEKHKAFLFCILFAIPYDVKSCTEHLIMEEIRRKADFFLYNQYLFDKSLYLKYNEIVIIS